MAFPAIRSESSGVDSTGADGNHAFALPATVSAGDYLVVFFVVDGSAAVTWDNSSAGTWTELVNTTSGSMRAMVMYKVADGTEDGVTITPTTVGAESHARWCWAFSGAAGIEAATATTGTSANPDSGSLAPSWGSADTKWLSLFGQNDGTLTVSAYPASYSDTGSQTGGGTGAVLLGKALRDNATGTEDPGAFTTTAVAQGWAAFTVGIRPAAASATLTDIDTDETITAGQTGIAYTGTGLTDADGLMVQTGTKEAAATAFSATNATSGTFTAPTAAAIRTAGVKFGSCTFSIEDGGVALATLAGTINPSSGLTVHNVSDISQAADEGCIYYGQSPAVAVNDQVLFASTTTSNGWAVTIDSQGFVTIDSGGSEAQDSFAYYIWDATDETWGAVGTWTVNQQGVDALIDVLQDVVSDVVINPL